MQNFSSTILFNEEPPLPREVDSVIFHVAVRYFSHHFSFPREIRSPSNFVNGILAIVKLIRILARAMVFARQSFAVVFGKVDFNGVVPSAQTKNYNCHASFFLFLDILKCPHIRSPEGSTLSICGDSQLEELSLDEGRSFLPGTSRDDSSELSFYRRFVEDHAACISRSCEMSRRETPSNVFSGVKCERSVSDSKLKKPKYRPYTIEEYRSLSVSRPDRSLGPDKDEIQAKVRFYIFN